MKRRSHTLRAILAIVGTVFAAGALGIWIFGPSYVSPVLVTGSVDPLGRERTWVCVHPGIVRLGACGFLYEPDPLGTVNVDGSGTFELHAKQGSLQALHEVTVRTAEAVDSSGNFHDDAVAEARADIQTAKKRELKNRSARYPHREDDVG